MELKFPLSLLRLSKTSMDIVNAKGNLIVRPSMHSLPFILERTGRNKRVKKTMVYEIKNENQAIEAGN